ncbi:Eco47II family restriction endonuclease [Pseudoalteromonas sp. 2CM28B]|uniref:Eco47II family restriction endonuclease n=1 Tax=Pseudoalteromonas sp. 2CM28B TaxID=2929851 RepID=UPI0020BE94E2|nr:Eco47II family restriction endonuclease [Pseudoalteromonas sp. 2CM28B]MCK8136339.1 Eco47II family restriction endonuclease [Pseudoalteromonas sp. 2CM28B]
MKAFDREVVKSAIKESVLRVYDAHHSNLDLYRNTLDCFSSSIDSVVQGISLDEWMLQEKERQVQKTKQNAIGTLHEEVMGAIPGVDNLAVGNLIDIVSDKHRIVAEVKNKHNTTKGNHRVAVYHDLAQALDKYPGFTGYYVEILPKGQKQYNKPFTPSDNKAKKKLPKREDIRVIDGKSFYELLTGVEGALSELYSELPILVAEILNEKYETKLTANKVTESEAFNYNFRKAYGG